MALQQMLTTYRTFVIDCTREVLHTLDMTHARSAMAV